MFWPVIEKFSQTLCIEVHIIAIFPESQLAFNLKNDEMLAYFFFPHHSNSLILS